MTDRYAAQETLTRTFSASIERVWAMWTTAEGLAAWHGPTGFETVVDTLELEPGGRFVFTMIAAGEQQAAWMKQQGRPTSWQTHCTVLEVEAPHRFVYESEVPMGPDTTAWMRHTVLLETTDGGVLLTLIMDATTAAMITPAAGGWTNSFGRLDGALAAVE